MAASCQAPLVERDPAVFGLLGAHVVVSVPDQRGPLFAVGRLEVLGARIAVGVSALDAPFVSNVELGPEAVARQTELALLDPEGLLLEQQVIEQHLLYAPLDEEVHGQFLLRAGSIGFHVDVLPFPGLRNLHLPVRPVESDDDLALALRDLELAGHPVELVGADAHLLGDLEQVFGLREFAGDRAEALLSVEREARFQVLAWLPGDPMVELAVVVEVFVEAPVPQQVWVFEDQRSGRPGVVPGFDRVVGPGGEDAVLPGGRRPTIPYGPDAPAFPTFWRALVRVVIALESLVWDRHLHDPAFRAHCSFQPGARVPLCALAGKRVRPLVEHVGVDIEDELPPVSVAAEAVRLDEELSAVALVGFEAVFAAGPAFLDEVHRFRLRLFGHVGEVEVPAIEADVEHGLLGRHIGRHHLHPGALGPVLPRALFAFRLPAVLIKATIQQRRGLDPLRD